MYNSGNSYNLDSPHYTFYIGSDISSKTFQEFSGFNGGEGGGRGANEKLNYNRVDADANGGDGGGKSSIDGGCRGGSD